MSDSEPQPLSSCCSTSDENAHACPKCGHRGPVVGVAPVRPHNVGAVDGDWQQCANEQCEVIYHLEDVTVAAGSVITQVGLKATDKPTPVCFCFAHTAADLEADLAANNGVSKIKAEIKGAVADSQCACEYLNPTGECCLADVHRTLKSFSQPTPA